MLPLNLATKSSPGKQDCISAIFSETEREMILRARAVGVSACDGGEPPAAPAESRASFSSTEGEASGPPGDDVPDRTSVESCARTRYGYFVALFNDIQHSPSRQFAAAGAPVGGLMKAALREQLLEKGLASGARQDTFRGQDYTHNPRARNAESTPSVSLALLPFYHRQSTEPLRTPGSRGSPRDTT